VKSRGISWVIFVTSLLIAPACGIFRAPQNAFWFLFPGTPIYEHRGCYFGLASIPPVLGVVTGGSRGRGHQVTQPHMLTQACASSGVHGAGNRAGSARTSARRARRRRMPCRRSRTRCRSAGSGTCGRVGRVEGGPCFSRLFGECGKGSQSGRWSGRFGNTPLNERSRRWGAIDLPSQCRGGGKSRPEQAEVFVEIQSELLGALENPARRSGAKPPAPRPRGSG
jgi:hypothetical protein